MSEEQKPYYASLYDMARGKLTVPKPEPTLAEQVANLTDELAAARAEAQQLRERLEANIDLVNYREELRLFATRDRIKAAEAENARLRSELEAITAGWPWYGDLDGKSLSQAVADEMHDYEQMIDNTSTVFGRLTMDRITKPNTLAVHVISEVEELQNRDIEEAVEEATIDLRTQIAQAVAALEKAVKDVRSKDVQSFCEVDLCGEIDNALALLRGTEADTAEQEA